MKVTAVLKTLRAAGKQLNRPSLYRYFTKLGIRPVVRQRPANYPGDTAAKIIAHLGLAPLAELDMEAFAKLSTGGRPGYGKTKIPAMPELRRVRAKAKARRNK
jgi:hypothetical protein